MYKFEPGFVVIVCLNVEELAHINLTSQIAHLYNSTMSYLLFQLHVQDSCQSTKLVGN